VLEIGTPLVDRHQNCDTLFFISRQGLIPRAESFAEVCYGVPLLHKDYSDPILARISLDNEGVTEIKQGQNWCLHQSSFLFLKR
jgi:hypothetical protein